MIMKACAACHSGYARSDSARVGKSGVTARSRFTVVAVIEAHVPGCVRVAWSTACQKMSDREARVIMPLFAGSLDQGGEIEASREEGDRSGKQGESRKERR